MGEIKMDKSINSRDRGISSNTILYSKGKNDEYYTPDYAVYPLTSPHS